MNEIPFDTMAAVRRLRESGIKEEQAEAITHTMRDVVTGGVATRADLARLEAELKGQISKSNADVKSDIDELKTDMKWIKVFIFLVIGGLAKLVFFP